MYKSRAYYLGWLLVVSKEMLSNEGVEIIYDFFEHCSRRELKSFYDFLNVVNNIHAKGLMKED